MLNDSRVIATSLLLLGVINGTSVLSADAKNFLFKQAPQTSKPTSLPATTPGSAVPGGYEQLLQKGIKLRRPETISMSVQYLDQAVKMRPRAFDSHLELSKSLVQAGSDDQAMAEAFESLKLELKNPAARLVLGDLFLKRQSWTESAGQYKQVIELEPRNIQARGNLALCLQELGYPEFAIQQLKALLQLQPDNEKALYNLAVAQQMSGHAEEAIGSYLDLIKKNPKNAFAYAGLGKCYVQKKDFSTAVAAEKESIKLDATNQFAFFVLAEALEGQGSKADSIDAYKKGIQLNPKDPAAKNALANLLHQKVAINPNNLVR